MNNNCPFCKQSLRDGSGFNSHYCICEYKLHIEYNSNTIYWALL